MTHLRSHHRVPDAGIERLPRLTSAVPCRWSDDCPALLHGLISRNYLGDDPLERPEAVGRAGHDPPARVGLERELEAVRGRDHRSRASVDGMNDLRVVDSA